LGRWEEGGGKVNCGRRWREGGGKVAGRLRPGWSSGHEGVDDLWGRWEEGDGKVAGRWRKVSGRCQESRGLT
jgi:hypothetical protein